MSDFTTTLTWKPGTQEAELKAGDKPAIAVMPPPEFGGKEGYWTPEEAFIGSIHSCLLMTTLYFVKQMKIQLSACESEATGSLGKTAQGLRFNGVKVSFHGTVAGADDGEKFEQAVAQAEKFCPVSAAVSVPIEVSATADTGS